MVAGIQHKPMQHKRQRWFHPSWKSESLKWCFVLQSPATRRQHACVYTHTHTHTHSHTHSTHPPTPHTHATHPHTPHTHTHTHPHTHTPPLPTFSFLLPWIKRWTCVTLANRQIFFCALWDLCLLPSPHLRDTFPAEQLTCPDHPQGSLIRPGHNSSRSCWNPAVVHCWGSCT